MTLKQEKFIMARLKDYEGRLSRLEKILSASVMADHNGEDGRSYWEADDGTHQTPSQSIEARLA